MAFYDNGNALIIAPFGRHSLVWEPNAADVAGGSFLSHVFKNGQLLYRLFSPNLTYNFTVGTAYFDNDGDVDSFWSLLIWGFVSGDRWQQNWVVRANTTDNTAKNVQYLRSRLDSDGGFVGGRNANYPT